MDPAIADDQLRWQLYNDHKKQAWEDIQSSTDSYDQSLLTLSSGGLGLSIAFIKDIVPLQQATWLCLLYSSWVAFAACILTTVVSFQIAIKTQKELLVNCGKYYIDKEDSYRDKRGKYSKILTGCTMIAGALFVLALACTIIFAVENVGRYSKMPHDGSNSRLDEGRGAVSMTPVPPQPVPKPATPPPTSASSPKKD
jgi:hypothetical protein